jgi:hypothetical protein
MRCNDAAPKSGLDLAFEPATHLPDGTGSGARDVRDRPAAPVDRAPVTVVPGPGDAAQARHEINRFVVSRLNHDPSNRVDQSPLAILKKGHKTEIEVGADPLGADIDPALARSRQDRTLAVALRHDRVIDIAQDTRTRRNGPGLIAEPQHACRAGNGDECGIAVPALRGVEFRPSQLPSDRMKPRLPSIDATNTSAPTER